MHKLLYKICPYRVQHVFSKGPTLPHHERMSSRAGEIGIVQENQKNMFLERKYKKIVDSGRLLKAL